MYLAFLHVHKNTWGTNTYNLHALSASTIETVYCLKERGVRDLPAQHGPYLVEKVYTTLNVANPNQFKLYLEVYIYILTSNLDSGTTA